MLMENQCFVQAHKCGGVKPVNGIHTLALSMIKQIKLYMIFFKGKRWYQWKERNSR
jgi:hypothetical protein